MANNLEWMRNLEEPEKYLDKDLRLVYENCGIDTVISLLEGLPSINVYISSASVTKAQKAYIVKYFDGNNQKELALEIGCSERLVFKVTKEAQQQRYEEQRKKSQANLFEGN